MDYQKLDDDLVKMFSSYPSLPFAIRQRLKDSIVELVKNEIENELKNEKAKQPIMEDGYHLKIPNATLANAWKE